jgi:hypothetical protein
MKHPYKRAMVNITKVSIKSLAQNTVEKQSHPAGKTSTAHVAQSAKLGNVSLDECTDVASRKEWLERSFLPNDLVDSTREFFQVVVRFCISRLYLDGALVKVDTAERISKDVWKLKVEEEFYVLEQTGEVLGRELREDWAHFILTETELDDLVKTKDSHDFPAGVARSFKGDRRMARSEILASTSSTIPARVSQSWNATDIDPSRSSRSTPLTTQLWPWFSGHPGAQSTYCGRPDKWLEMSMDQMSFGKRCCMLLLLPHLFEFDCFVVDEYTLSLVHANADAHLAPIWFRFPPRSYFRSKLAQCLLIRTLEQDFRRLRYSHLDVHRDVNQYWMGKAQFDI